MQRKKHEKKKTNWKSHNLSLLWIILGLLVPLWWVYGSSRLFLGVHCHRRFFWGTWCIYHFVFSHWLTIFCLFRWSFWLLETKLGQHFLRHFADSTRLCHIWKCCAESSMFRMFREQKPVCVMSYVWLTFVVLRTCSSQHSCCCLSPKWNFNMWSYLRNIKSGKFHEEVICGYLLGCFQRWGTLWQHQSE